MHLLEGSNSMDILRQLGAELYRQGYVKESYIDAVIEREKEFPTGLPTKGVGIAIPHADAIHVNEEALILGILKEPVNFTVMGSHNDQVEVQLVFMLAIKDPQMQLNMLKRLMEGCQKEEVLYTLRNHDDLREVDRIMKGFMD